jgi:hypothetical protein
VLKKGAVGDAYSKEPTKEALENYIKAVDANKMISPRFLLKQVRL